jgi:four helix bundle protein
LSLEYVDHLYDIAGLLPRNERFNLISQMTRAGTSIALNIAEGSTGQTDQEQARFLGLAIRSALETVACLHLIRRRYYLADQEPLRTSYKQAEILVAKLHTMRQAIAPNKAWLRENPPTYDGE